MLFSKIFSVISSGFFFQSVNCAVDVEQVVNENINENQLESSYSSEEELSTDGFNQMDVNQTEENFAGRKVENVESEKRNSARFPHRKTEQSHETQPHQKSYQNCHDKNCCSKKQRKFDPEVFKKIMTEFRKRNQKPATRRQGCGCGRTDCYDSLDNLADMYKSLDNGLNEESFSLDKMTRQLAALAKKLKDVIETNETQHDEL